MNVMIVNQCSPNKGDRAVLTFLAQELMSYGVSSVVVSTSDARYWSNSDLPDSSRIRFVPYGWDVNRRVAHVVLESRVVRRVWHRRIAFSLVRRALISGSARKGLTRVLCNREFLEALNDADFVISTGGHHITTLLCRDAISPQLFDMGVVLLHGKQLALWSQTIGPLDFVDSRNQKFVTEILSRCRSIYLRDHGSVNELRRLSVSHPRVRLTYESVIGLTDAVKQFTLPSVRKPEVGISVYAVKERTAEEARLYVGLLAGLLDYLVQCGYTPKFFPMEMSGSSADDRPMIRDILRNAQFGSHAEVVWRDLPTLQHLAEVANCRAFIGHKTHSIVFALVTGTPLVAIAYHKKAQDFMRQYHLTDYCLLDRNLELAHLTSKLDVLLENQDGVAKREIQTSRQFGQAVRRDFRELLTDISQTLA